MRRLPFSWSLDPRSDEHHAQLIGCRESVWKRLHQTGEIAGGGRLTGMRACRHVKRRRQFPRRRAPQRFGRPPQDAEREGHRLVPGKWPRRFWLAHASCGCGGFSPAPKVRSRHSVSACTTGSAALQRQGGDIRIAQIMAAAAQGNAEKFYEVAARQAAVREARAKGREVGDVEGPFQLGEGAEREAQGVALAAKLEPDLAASAIWHPALL
jgi:hypothetical protein